MLLLKLKEASDSRHRTLSITTKELCRFYERVRRTDWMARTVQATYSKEELPGVFVIIEKTT